MSADRVQSGNLRRPTSPKKNSATEIQRRAELQDLARFVGLVRALNVEKVGSGDGKPSENVLTTRALLRATFTITTELGRYSQTSYDHF